MVKLSIAKDFTDTPGLRHIIDGPFSGEEFRETLLKVKFAEALEANDKLEVDLDGTYGYSTSFLDEAFGGLAKEFGCDKVKYNIIIISNEDRGLHKKIETYIEKALS